MRIRNGWMVLMLAVVCFLSACGQAQEKTEQTVDKQDWTQEQWAEYRLEVTESFLETVTEEDLAQMEMADYLARGDVFEEGLSLLAEIPEKDCYLYWYGSEGHVPVLRWKGQWMICANGEISMAPWRAMPEMICCDYDEDGTEEILIRGLAGYGSGFLVEALSVVEESAGVCHAQRYDAYLDEVQERVIWDWKEETRTLHVKVDGEEQDLVWDLDPLLSYVEEEDGAKMEDPVCFQGVRFGEQVYFEQREERIWLILDGGYQLNVGVQPRYEEQRPVLEAEVLYEEGEFRLGEIELRKSSE